MLKIEKAIALNKIGRRTNNEDSVYPILAEGTFSEEWKSHIPSIENLYLVCDGVGGANKGEIASQLACKHLAQYIAVYPPKIDEVLSDEYLQNALSFIERNFDEYIAQNPESRGMGTTFTLLFFNKAGANIAWAGDSRVYHLRKEQKLFQTEDHSLVNHLLRLGQIKPEEVRGHKQRNVILRAIQGTENPTKLQTHFIPWAEIHQNDFFFLASDGIGEGVSEEELLQLTGYCPSIDSILESIQNNCAEKSKDNYSCYLLEMGEKIAEINTILMAEKKEDTVSLETIPPVVEEEEPETIIMQSPKIQAQTIAAVPVESPTITQTTPLHARLQQEASNKPEWIRTSLESVLPVYSAENEAVVPKENSGLPAWAWLILLTMAIGGAWGIYQFALPKKSPTLKYYQCYAQAENDFIKGDFEAAVVAADSARKNAKTQAQADSASILIQQINEKRIVAKDANTQPTNPPKQQPVVITDNQSTVTPSTPVAEDKPQTLTRGGEVLDEKKKAEAQAKTDETARKSDAGLAEAKAKYKEAVKSASPDDYQVAVDKLTKTGDKMDGEAAYMLAYIYSRGANGKTDHANALKYAETASKKGWVAGSYYYGHLLLLKKSKNDTTAAKAALKLAASKGNPDAKERLSRLGVK